MKHPAESVLALYAGGELRWPSRWQVRRHVARCMACRGDLEGFRAIRDGLLAAAPEAPAEVNWPRLAADMRANIRVGIAAAECVTGPPTASPAPTWRTAAALATITVLIFAGVWLQRANPPAPGGSAGVAPAPEGIVLEATPDGIRVRQGDAILALQHTEAHDVSHTVSARGTLGARFVDAETGYVTITHVYAE
jgi:hypothetical protein